MKVAFKFQEGGAMSAPAPAPQGVVSQQESQKTNPLIQIAQLATQALLSKDCQIALAVCEAFIQLIQQNSAEGAPQEAPMGEPVYKKGGILTRRINN